jgi:hypothetical protein
VVLAPDKLIIFIAYMSFLRLLKAKPKNLAIKNDLWKSMIHCFKKCSVMVPEKCGVEFEVPV